MTKCPHCDEQLPAVADAFCPACRLRLDETPDSLFQRRLALHRLKSKAKPTDYEASDSGLKNKSPYGWMIGICLGVFCIANGWNQFRKLPDIASMLGGPVSIGAGFYVLESIFFQWHKFREESMIKGMVGLGGSEFIVRVLYFFVAIVLISLGFMLANQAAMP